MRPRCPRLFACIGLVATLGCGEGPGSVDAAATSDDATDPQPDVALAADASGDALAGLPDASARDASLLDAWRAAVDAAEEDAGPPVLHDCRVFEDRSAPDADRTVTFGSAGTYTYEPACLRIAPGQSVTFSGRFTHHPLAPGRSPLRPLDPPGSGDTPMVAVEEGTTAAVTFTTAGDYPYYCPVHDRLGMWGVVRVE